MNRRAKQEAAAAEKAAEEKKKQEEETMNAIKGVGKIKITGMPTPSTTTTK